MLLRVISFQNVTFSIALIHEVNLEMHTACMIGEHALQLGPYIRGLFQVRNFTAAKQI